MFYKALKPLRSKAKKKKHRKVNCHLPVIFLRTQNGDFSH